MGQRVQRTRFETAPNSGFGFAQKRREQAADELQGRLTTETPEQLRIRQTLQGQLSGEAANIGAGRDAGFQQQFGQALSSRLGSFGQGETQRRGVFEAEQQRGLENSLAQIRRQSGGTGLAGSSQSGRALGGILAQAQEGRSQGLLNLRNQGTQELGALQTLQSGGLQDLLSILGGQQRLQGQDIAERNLQFGQGTSIADLLQQQAESELGRQSGLRGVGQGGLPQTSDFATGLGGLAGIAGTVGGFGTAGGGTIGADILGFGGGGGGLGNVGAPLQGLQKRSFV